MENQGRDKSYDSAEMGDEGRNVNYRAGDRITVQPQLFKDDFTNQGTDYHQQARSDGQINQGYKASGNDGYMNQSSNDGYMNEGYKNSGNDGYMNQSGNAGYMNQGYQNSGNDDYMNQGYKTSGNDDYMNQGHRNSGQDNSFLQQTGGGVMNMAQGAMQGATSVAKGAAMGAANIAQGAATTVKNTLGMNNETSSTTGTADTTTVYHPSNRNSRV